MSLHYETSGSGPNTVVLVHGFPLTSQMWRAQIDALASDGWRVVAVDLPGFGGSPGGIESVEQAADDVLGVIDELGLDRVVLAGFSMGGYVAFAFVRRHAARLRALMLVDTRAEADTEEGRQGRHATAKIAREQGARPVVDAMLPRLVADATLNGRPDVVARVLDIAAGATAEGIAKALEAMAARPSSVELLPQIAVPTLVIAGHDDVLVPVAASELMAREIPDARLVIIPDAGHSAPIEQPEAVNVAMREFLASLEA